MHTHALVGSRQREVISQRQGISGPRGIIPACAHRRPATRQRNCSSIFRRCGIHLRTARSSSNLLRFPSDRGGGNTGGPTARQAWIVSHFGFAEAPAADDRRREVSATFEATADDGRFPFFILLVVATITGPQMSSTEHQEREEKTHTKVVGGVRELCDRYDGFILDQFGVLHDGRDALPGAVECLEELRRQGKRLVVLSNTSKREAFTMDRLPTFGFRRDLFDGGVTSGEEGFQYLARNGLVGGKAVLLGWNGEDSDGFLQALALDYSNPQEATFLLCHGPDNIVDDTGATRTGTRNSGSVEPYEALFQIAIDRGLPMYNVNPDITVNNPQGGRWFMPGLLSKKYEDMGGVVQYFGKPHKEHYEAAVAKMGLEKDRVVHVGDSLAHDIVGAESAGMESLFIAGGICGEELGVDARAGKPPFDLSTETLQKLFTQESVTPTWTMPLFAL